MDPTKGHYWEPGKPLPDQDVLDLIELSDVSTGQLPEWAQDLGAHREEANQDEDGAPKKKAHREEAGHNKEEESNLLFFFCEWGGVHKWQSLSIHTWLH